MIRVIIGIVISSAPLLLFAQIELDKAMAIKKYKTEYKASEIKEAREIKWSGNVAACVTGDISNKVREKALTRINYFRTLSGLKKINFANENNLLAQEAAFIIFSNNKVDHDPNESWKCFSPERRRAAGRSLLGMNNFVYYPEIAFITGFIKDHGELNKGVGHRRALLYSRAQALGYGATDKAEAISSPIHDLSSADTLLFPKYFSYPVSGYNEVDLCFPRWSFSIPDANKVDFSNSKIELHDGSGKVIEVSTFPIEDYYDPAIVWELKGKVDRDYLLNNAITVSISGVSVNGSIRDYSYRVLFFDCK